MLILKNINPKKLILPKKVKVEDYLYLAEVVARKFYKGKDPIRDTEYFSIACHRLIICVKKYIPKMGPFDRLAFRAMKNGIIQHIRQNKCKKRSASFSSLTDKLWQQVEQKETLFEENNIPDISFHKMTSCLDLEDKTFLNLCIKYKTIAEIAEVLNVSRPTVYSRKNKIFEKIKEALNVER